MVLGFKEALKKGLEPVYILDGVTKSSVKKKLKKLAKRNGLRALTEAKVKGLKV